jgi:hypothetical protein
MKEKLIQVLLYLSIVLVFLYIVWFVLILVGVCDTMGVCVGPLTCIP